MRKSSRVYGPLLVIVAFVAAVVVAIWMDRAAFPWLNPAGIIASYERTIFLIVVGISVVVVAPVFTLMIVFALKYREGNKKADYQPEWNNNTKLEIAWWGIPIFIILIVGTISWISTHRLDPYRPIASKNKTLNVQVVAMEWKWLFLYPDHHVATINQLKIPVDTPVHFMLSADAPMSAFWVPSLGSQIYTMSGMSSQLNLMATKTGTYNGYNTNINGEGYAKMNFTVPVVSRNDFASWTKKTTQSSKVMDGSVYKKLAKPSVVKSPSSYKLTDNTLYDTIVMKYMAPMDGQAMTPSTKQTDKKTDLKGQSMPAMEGM